MYKNSPREEAAIYIQSCEETAKPQSLQLWVCSSAGLMLSSMPGTLTQALPLNCFLPPALLSSPHCLPTSHPSCLPPFHRSFSFS